MNDTVDTTSELQNKKKIADLEAENKSQSLELDKLKEYIQDLEEEKSTWEHEKTAFEQEKEELEQMLEDERHTFEHNRQSVRCFDDI
jgi:regulator of replication initiation timing